MSFHATALPVLEGVLFASVYALLWYARRRQSAGEEFSPYKFAATVVLGAIIGGVLVLSGDPLSQATVEAKLVTYAGLLTVITPTIRMVVDGLRRQ